MGLLGLVEHGRITTYPTKDGHAAPHEGGSAGTTSSEVAENCDTGCREHEMFREAEEGNGKGKREHPEEGDFCESLALMRSVCRHTSAICSCKLFCPW